MTVTNFHALCQKLLDAWDTEDPFTTQLVVHVIRAALEQEPISVVEEKSLMEAVTDAIVDVCGADYGCSRAAILAVADWMEKHNSRMTAAVLRQEVENE